MLCRVVSVSSLENRVQSFDNGANCLDTGVRFQSLNV